MAAVLVIDDEPIIRELIAEILADAGHDVAVAASAEEGLLRIVDRSLEIVVSDIVMPGLTGLELLEKVRMRRPSLPVVLVTGAGTHAMLADALAGGAAGLVMKPFSHAELQGAVATALARAAEAERELRERLLTPTLASALANAIEARDSTMQGHCERMSALATRLAAELRLSEAEVESVRLGAILHDIGKIGIPDSVLMNERTLTDEERALMRTHPLIGDRLLEPLDLLAGARPIVRYHHECWDGSGYPDGIEGDRIPLAARIVALADAVEAMSAKRRYRVPLATDEIVGELRSGRGRQWDPDLVDLVLRLIGDGVLRFGASGLEIAEPDAVASACSGHAVLLVDDDAQRALVARDALESTFEHVLVRHAPTAAAAVELCRGSTWSLAVVAETLPDASGLELMQTLASLTPDVPVVMLTADASEALAVEAVRRGAADFVVKSDGFGAALADRARALLSS
jgi:putative two-component system response regulator